LNQGSSTHQLSKVVQAGNRFREKDGDFQGSDVIKKKKGACFEKLKGKESLTRVRVRENTAKQKGHIEPKDAVGTKLVPTRRLSQGSKREAHG